MKSLRIVKVMKRNRNRPFGIALAFIRYVAEFLTRNGDHVR